MQTLVLLIGGNHWRGPCWREPLEGAVLEGTIRWPCWREPLEGAMLEGTIRGGRVGGNH